MTAIISAAPLLVMPLLVPVVIFLVALILFVMVFWIWMLISAIQNKGLTDGEKTGWVLGIVFFHFIASLLYFFIGRPKRNHPLARV